MTLDESSMVASTHQDSIGNLVGKCVHVYRLTPPSEQQEYGYEQLMWVGSDSYSTLTGYAHPMIRLTSKDGTEAWLNLALIARITEFPQGDKA